MTFCVNLFLEAVWFYIAPTIFSRFALSLNRETWFLLGKRIKVNADMYKEKRCKCPGRKKEAIALKGENVGGLQTQDWLHNTHDRGVDGAEALQ